MTTTYLTRSGAAYTGKHTETAEGKIGYRVQEKCNRCGGLGGSEAWRFTGWTCYLCGGRGLGPVRFERLYTESELAKLNATKAKRDAKLAAKRAAAQAAAEAEANAKREAWIAAHAELVAAIERHAAGNTFLAEMRRAIAERGELTERQAAAASTSVERIKARQAAAASSQHVGTIGQRVRLALTVERVIDITPYSQPYGFARRYLVLAKDAAGNVITYKGSAPFAAEGEAVDLTAAVEEHGEYNGTKQTRIARPRVAAAAA